jgi:PDZ domain
MRILSVLVVMMLLVGCQEQSTARADQAPEKKPAIDQSTPVQVKPDEIAIFPKGSKLEPADYSAVWGVVIKLHDLSKSEKDNPVVISRVHPGLPAGLSGVVEGATILKFNGREIRNQTDLYNTIRDLPFESTNIPFTQKLPSGEIQEGSTFVIHIEITGLKHYFEQLKARSRK